MNIRPFSSPFKPVVSGAGTVLILLQMAAFSASAATVQVNGGFTRFSGPASDNYDLGGIGQIYNTYVDTQEGLNATSDQVLPTSPSPVSPSEWPALGIGGISFPSPVETVTFYTTHTEPDPGDPGLEVTVRDLENAINFTPGPVANVGVGDEFLLGTFTLVNGLFWAGRGNPEVDFSIRTNSADPAFDGHAFTDTLEFVMTPNAGTPEEKADFFFFQGRRDLGSMRIFEAGDGQYWGSIDLYGKVGSLIPTRLANPQGGVFFDPGTPPPDNVPESGSMAVIWGLALTSLAAGYRMIKRSANLSA